MEKSSILLNIHASLIQKERMMVTTIRSLEEEKGKGGRRLWREVVREVAGS